MQILDTNVIVVGIEKTGNKNLNVAFNWKRKW
jgi:hypothetical protein